MFCSVEDLVSFDSRAAPCNELLDGGIRKIVQGLSQRSLLEYLVPAPTEMALILNFQFLQDVTRASPDISESYWQYLKGVLSVHNDGNDLPLLITLAGI